MTDSSRISPTAHYTGYVWCRHRLSPPGLETTTGRFMFEALRWPMHLAAKANRGLTLELLLLQRHLIIDHVLREAVESGAVAQIVEVAAGMSGRGLRLTQRYPRLTYLEADLPGMAARKRERLAALGATHRHRVLDVDALATSGALSLVEAARPHLDPTAGTAIVTEGLVNYFPRESVERIWTNLSALLACSSAGGLYVTDLHLLDGQHRRLLIRTFRALLGTFTGGGVHLSYQSDEEAAAALERCGFSAGTRFVRPADVERDVPIPPSHGLRYVNIVVAPYRPVAS